MNRKLPFYENRSDNLCLHSCVRSILEHSFDKTANWKYVDSIVGQPDRFGTWPFYLMNELTKLGFRVFYIDEYDENLFASDPYKFFVSVFGKEQADRYVSNTDIPALRRDFFAFLKNKNIKRINKVPTVSDLKMSLEWHCYPIVTLNYWTLIGVEGKYASHAVLVEGIEDRKIRLMNPGPPGIEDQIVPIEQFERAWYFPNCNASNLIIVCPQTVSKEFDLG